MRRTTPLTAATLLGLALLVPTTSASAAADTCRGEAATIVGTPGVAVSGTEGRDVIVSSGASVVDALGGDDLVCVTGSGELALVVAGAGDDVVDASQAGPATLRVALGDGNDAFVGSAPHLLVWAASPTSKDDGTDDIHVNPLPGGTATVESGARDLPNADRVLLDGEGEVRWQGAVAPGASLSGGKGSRLRIGLPPGAVTADLRTGRVIAHGSNGLGWTGFDSFRFEDTQGTTTSLDLMGTAGHDEVDLYLLGRATRVRADLGRGRDTLNTTTIGAPGSRFSGGPGRDLIGIVAWGDLEADLPSGVVTQRLAGQRRLSPARSFEDVDLWGRRAEVTGDAGDNTITIGGCRRSVVAGRGGDDVITFDGSVAFDGRTCIRTPGVRFSGGSGVDVLVGGNGDDVLVGGRGRDRADGGEGADRCAAEKTTGCER